MSPKSRQDKRRLPSHIPAWMQECVRRTGEAYRRWAEASFKKKMDAFLATDEEEDSNEEDDGLDKQHVE